MLNNPEWVLTPFVITHLSNGRCLVHVSSDVLTPFVITHLSNVRAVAKAAAAVLTPFVITHLSNRPHKAC